jgi:hypothetical protein
VSFCFCLSDGVFLERGGGKYFETFAVSWLFLLVDTVPPPGEDVMITIQTNECTQL